MPATMLDLPPLIGHTDPEAEAALAAKREEAREWMRARGITDLSVPEPLVPHPTLRVVYSCQSHNGGMT